MVDGFVVPLQVQEGCAVSSADRTASDTGFLACEIPKLGYFLNPVYPLPSDMCSYNGGLCNPPLPSGDIDYGMAVECIMQEGCTEAVHLSVHQGSCTTPGDCTTACVEDTEDNRADNNVHRFMQCAETQVDPSNGRDIRYIDERGVVQDCLVQEGCLESSRYCISSSDGAANPNGGLHQGGFDPEWAKYQECTVPMQGYHISHQVCEFAEHLDNAFTPGAGYTTPWYGVVHACQQQPFCETHGTECVGSWQRGDEAIGEHPISVAAVTNDHPDSEAAQWTDGLRTPNNLPSQAGVGRSPVCNSEQERHAYQLVCLDNSNSNRHVGFFVRKPQPDFLHVLVDANRDDHDREPHGRADRPWNMAGIAQACAEQTGCKTHLGSCLQAHFDGSYPCDPDYTEFESGGVCGNPGACIPETTAILEDSGTLVAFPFVNTFACTTRHGSDSVPMESPLYANEEIKHTARQVWQQGYGFDDVTAPTKGWPCCTNAYTCNACSSDREYLDFVEEFDEQALPAESERTRERRDHNGDDGTDYYARNNGLGGDGDVDTPDVPLDFVPDQNDYADTFNSFPNYPSFMDKVLDMYYGYDDDDYYKNNVMGIDEVAGPGNHMEVYSFFQCLITRPGYSKTAAGIVYENFCNRHIFTEGVVGAVDEEGDFYSVDLDGPLQGKHKPLGRRTGCIESTKPRRGFLSAVTKPECTVTCADGYHAVYEHDGHYYSYCPYEKHDHDMDRINDHTNIASPPCPPKVVRTLRCGLDGGDPYMDEDEMGMAELICVADGTEHYSHGGKSAKHHSHRHHSHHHLEDHDHVELDGTPRLDDGVDEYSPILPDDTTGSFKKGKKAHMVPPKEPKAPKASKDGKSKGENPGGGGLGVSQGEMRTHARKGTSFVVAIAVGLAAGVFGALFGIATQRQTNSKQASSPEPEMEPLERASTVAKLLKEHVHTEIM